MNCYKCKISTCINDKKVYEHSFLVLSEVSPEQITNVVDTYGWDNVEEFIKHSYNYFILKYKNKGKQLTCISDSSYHVFKEWKTDIYIETKREYEQYTPSLKELIEYNDSTRVIQYMKEQGDLF